MEKLIRFAKEYGTRICIAHTSTPEAMELIKKARAEGQDIYLETAPHYLLLSEETIDKLGPFAKGNPPLRSRESMEALWKYVNDGSVVVFCSVPTYDPNPLTWGISSKEWSALSRRADRRGPRDGR